MQDMPEETSHASSQGPTTSGTHQGCWDFETWSRRAQYPTTQSQGQAQQLDQHPSTPGFWINGERHDHPHGSEIGAEANPYSCDLHSDSAHAHATTPVRSYSGSLVSLQVRTTTDHSSGSENDHV